ncbi:MAG: trypsin-like peptidase domain-containing protein [Acidimicrobiia bacterium]
MRWRFLVVTVVFAVTAVACTSDGGTATSPPPAGPALDVVLTDVSELVKAVEPSVVTVTQTQLRLDDLGTLTEVPTGTGTGVVVDLRGHVLTNAHVIAGAQDVLVVGFDGKARQAQVVGTWSGDQNSDLALLLLEDATGLAPIVIGESRALEVGDPVVAIGNALGLGLSVSVGIVSAKGRQVRTDTSSLEGALQTDAAINPGNSGGPLLNAAGELVGINTAVAGDAENIGFAIPSDQVVPFVDYVVGEAGQPFIGVSLLTLTPQLVGRFGLAVEEGSVITEVLAGGAAAQAGLEWGDIVIAIDGQSITSREELLDHVEEAGVGATMTLTVVRDPQVSADASNIEVAVLAR